LWVQKEVGEPIARGRHREAPQKPGKWREGGEVRRMRREVLGPLGESTPSVLEYERRENFSISRKKPTAPEPPNLTRRVGYEKPLRRQTGKNMLLVEGKRGS